MESPRELSTEEVSSLEGWLTQEYGVGPTIADLIFTLRQRERELAEARKVGERFQNQRDDEAWMHAACLSIAEGIDGWDNPSVDDSIAMITVRELRNKHEQAKRQLSEAQAEVEAQKKGNELLAETAGELKMFLHNSRAEVERQNHINDTLDEERKILTRQLAEAVKRRDEWIVRCAASDLDADGLKGELAEVRVKMERLEEDLRLSRAGLFSANIKLCEDDKEFLRLRKQLAEAYAAIRKHWPKFDVCTFCDGEENSDGEFIHQPDCIVLKAEQEQAK